MTEIAVYSTKTCTNCPILKELLRSNNIPFKDIDMANPEILTELSMKGVFSRMVPILQIDDKFYNKEIVDGNKLNINKVKEIIKWLKETIE